MGPLTIALGLSIGGVFTLISLITYTVLLRGASATQIDQRGLPAAHIKSTASKETALV
jgi:hypothetical protein